MPLPLLVDGVLFPASHRGWHAELWCVGLGSGRQGGGKLPCSLRTVPSRMEGGDELVCVCGCGFGCGCVGVGLAVSVCLLAL